VFNRVDVRYPSSVDHLLSYDELKDGVEGLIRHE
jgi:hypothetical protein